MNGYKIPTKKYGEKPAEMRSKSRRDSLFTYWGQIITIEYYRVFDTLSNFGTEK